MSFKLLAISISADSPFQKKLKSNVLYKFSNDAVFKDINGKILEKVDDFRQISEVEDLQTFPSTLFNITGYLDRIIDVNVSALLGRNGSGKSSLLELFYLLIFCLSELKDLIELRDALKVKKEQNPQIEQWGILLDKIKDTLSSTRIEFYYQIGEETILLKKSEKQINHYFLQNGHWNRKKFDYKKLFYTICVNYSQYGLNATGNYHWLRPLFHKNDGYKTPIVLNPFRSNGNININIELDLAQTRILTNLSNTQLTSQHLIDDKYVNSVDFTIRTSKLGRIEDIDISEFYKISLEQKYADLADIFSLAVIHFSFRAQQGGRLEASSNRLKQWLGASEPLNLLKSRQNISRNFDSKLLEYYLTIYIITKIVKIANTYSDFKNYTTEYLDSENKVKFLMISDVKGLVSEIARDQSHVTLKLKQAINAYIHKQLFELKWIEFQDEEFPDYFGYRTRLDFSDFKIVAQNALASSLSKKKTLSQFIPVAFFRPSINVSEGTGEYPFSQMSSGEQQLLHSIHSILYHLLNLDSRDESTYSYRYVNLILDEIELYYHPSYQRDFLKALLENIQNANLKNIVGLNILFSTHSPFILSDIPHTNLLKLQDGLPFNLSNNEPTFGANIHEMLADSFFLDEKLMGAFAEKTIEKCIDHLEQIRLFREREEIGDKKIKTPIQTKKLTRINEEIDDIEHKIIFQTYEDAINQERKDQNLYRTIQLIGEPVIRFKLLEMYNEAIPLGDDSNQQTEAKRMIRELMVKNNIDLKDL